MNLLQSLGIPGPEPSFLNGNYKERTAMVALCYSDLKVTLCYSDLKLNKFLFKFSINHWSKPPIVYVSFIFATTNVDPETMCRAGGWGTRNTHQGYGILSD